MSQNHPEWCTKSDDPNAVALWNSNRATIGEVWCGNHRHRLAKVYDLGDTGLVVCFPRFSIKMDYLELADVTHGPDADAHYHAAMYRLDELSGSQPGRCACGTYNMRSERLRQLGTDGLREVVAEWTLGRRERQALDVTGDMTE